MAAEELTAADLTLPIKRTDGATLEERLTSNAYNNILPARYLRKDAEGNLTETQEELFERVAKNIALAEAVFEAGKQGIEVTVTPEQVKPNHPRREELAAEVFGTAEGDEADEDGEAATIPEDAETVLTAENVNKFAYETIVPELPDEIREHVESVAGEYRELMESLSFIPNSPTLMNAGDELQQLSACFVDSPEDDLTDIHQTAKEAAEVFQSGGGMGYAFWRLRPYGDPVGSTGGIASGPITFMETFDQMCETIAQGGTRRGAQMGVMRVSHPDVIEFIHSKNKDVSLAHCLRLNDPDDYTYTTFAEALEEARGLIDEDGKVPKHLRNAVEGHLSNFNISVGVTDGFMEALYEGEEFTFTNPRTEEPHVATHETKEMYDRYGLGEYVEPGEEFSIPAQVLWDRIVDGAYENGEPGVIYLERVNKQHSFDVEEHPDHRILATNPCVTGDTLISTDNGLVPAEELYEQGVAQDVVVDGRLSDDRVKEASSVYKTGEKDVCRLTMAEGYELRLTADHRVMTDEGWVEAGELDEGDTVHIQNRKGGFGQHGSAEEGRVLGWLVGDGHLKDGEERAVLNFYDEDADVSESFATDVNEVVREPTGSADYEIGVNEIARNDDYRGAQAIEQRIRSTRLYEYAEEAGLVEEKLRVPDAVMRGSEEMARGFLQALFTADGGVQGNVEKGVSVRLASTSSDLLKQVQQLLLNFGIASKIYEDRKDAGVTELPDGRGGTREYDTEGFHELVVVKDNLVRFADEIGFLLDYKTDALENRLDDYDRGPYSEQFEATVESVESDGHETVYDLTEPETHSFVANGLVTHNCGEQPLEEYEACNLGHINLSTLAATDAPDWRVWHEDHADEYDSEEAAVEAFLEDAMDWEAFDHRVEWGTRFLENVVTMSDFPVPEIEEKVREMRKIGLGVMGLAQLYVQLGVRYGSDEGNEIARQLMRHINHGSKWASHELAGERGSFADWGDSKYADPLEYREWFEHHTGLDAEEWADGFPIRNHNTTTIAPTGTTSMVGNTTGGCEPIYNVAYYKNVSDDVQGDEMLVEFDDYFLRTLEANDIDVDAVKREAQEQMSTNEFDGVEGLETVPDAIGELFVVTADLRGKEHAAVQCALQGGVDSAISKTCNFPNSASKEDMDEVYRYIYDHGGKGVTVYRDGTRSKQVLTTRADNAEYAEMDEEEAAAAILEDIDEAFGDIERFLDHEAVEERLGDAIELLSDADAATLDELEYAEKQSRPDVLRGVTQRIDTGYGKVYITINEDAEKNRPFELFANTGMSGGFTASFTEALAKSISVALRSGVDPNEIADKLRGIRSPKVAWDKGEQINSIPDAFGVALRRYLDDEIDRPYPRQQNLTEVGEGDAAESEAVDVEVEPDTAPETDGGHGGAAAATPGGEEDATQSLIDAGESPECPDCGSMSLYFSEGCKTCQACGWSEC
ncbi:LAGLIDADG family homing endonuclease [Salinirubellus sp. GCM10025818]|uniref:LAGLIDADG family homing endonuclease n=1 Tax=Salinirubellus TaxID=2162630 RepID=UPI0030CF842D